MENKILLALLISSFWLAVIETTEELTTGGSFFYLQANQESFKKLSSLQERHDSQTSECLLKCKTEQQNCSCIFLWDKNELLTTKWKRTVGKPVLRLLHSFTEQKTDEERGAPTNFNGTQDGAWL